MGNFNDFMFAKTIEKLADRCVREKLPIVEFIQWYEEEGHLLPEAWYDNMLHGALAGGGYGAGVGTLAGLPGIGTGTGAAIGAGLGGLYGLGKSAYDYFSKPKPGYEASKQDAINALAKFAKFSPGNEKQLSAMVNWLSRVNPSGNAGGGGGATPTQSPAVAAKRASAKNQAAQNAADQQQQAALQANTDELKKSLGSFLNDDVIGNLAYNNITPDKWKAAFDTHKGLPTDEAIENTLKDLGIRNRAGGHYRYNASTGHFEHKVK